MSRTDSSRLITAVAQLVSEATSLGDVVSRLAGTLREAVPFDRLHLLRLDRADMVTLYTARASGELEAIAHRIADRDLASMSAAATSEPDGAPVLAGVRSVMICPLRHGTRVAGALWLTAEAPHAFDDSHHVLLDELADLVGLAVLQESLMATEAVRRERLESLERLLRTVAGALDVRNVFQEVSDVIKAALPHDVLTLTEWVDDGRRFRVHALSGVQIDDPTFWAPVALDRDEQALLNSEPYIVRDVGAEVPPNTVRGRLFRRVGAHSVLRVALPLQNDVFGSLLFLSSEHDHFSDDDLDFARRVASYIALAISHQRLSEAARRDAEARETAMRLEAQVAVLRRELDARAGHARVIGSSPRWRDVLAHAARVAPTDTTVLLTGESGTGKEVVARFIHHASPRSGGPFVAINCAALPDQLLESELFGHERGAFTGAVAAKPGRIEQANGGVLFLDEIGEMSTAVQAKLLRVLEEREFLRLGSTRLLRADIRVIAATNRNLLTAIRSGSFREDLYYRLSVFDIALPPLRDRTEDILELAQEFLDELGHTIGKPTAGLSREARDQLQQYPWPGNVRELRNAIERAVILADGGVVRGEHLPFHTARTEPVSGQSVSAEGSLPAGGVDLEAIERSLVERALNQARHNKTRAARLLGLTRSQLYTRIEKYKLAEQRDPD